MANFDDLFNDFFNRKRTNNDTRNDDIKKIINALFNFKMDSLSDNFSTFEDSIEKELGEPTEIIEHIQDGMLFKKLIWKTSHGEFVKIIVSDVVEEEKPKTLQEQLKEAVEREDYELAIKLRDEIKKTNKKKTRRKL